MHQKLTHMSALSDSKYVSLNEFSNIKERAGIFEEKIRGLEQRFNDDIASRKYLTATITSIISLVLAIIMSSVTIGDKISVHSITRDNQASLAQTQPLHEPR